MSDAPKDPTATRPGIVRRAVRLTWRIALTLAVAAGALFAVQQGSAELGRRADAAPSPQAAPVMSVETRPAVLQPGYQISRVLVGQVEPRRTVAVSFELSGRLDQIRVEEGDRVAAGEVIATLDTKLLDAERTRLDASKAALEAQLRFAMQTVERQSQLSDRGFASQAGLDEALSRADELRSRIAEVDASLNSNAIRSEKSVVSAPFAGTVTERRVDGGESLAPGQPIVGIVQHGAPQLRIGVPLDFTAEDLAAATIEVGTRSFGAKLLTLRPDIDPVTRTRTALFEVQTDQPLAFGRTARLTLTDHVATQGLWVPITTLKEGLRGQWTLLAVDADSRVRALSVQVLHTHADQVFVRGAIPEGTRLITAGPQRVTVGQTVDARAS